MPKADAIHKAASTIRAIGVVMTVKDILEELPQLSPDELVQLYRAINEIQAGQARAERFRSNPAIGAWKDRADLPEDSADAAIALRRRAMKRIDEINE